MSEVLKIVDLIGASTILIATSIIFAKILLKNKKISKTISKILAIIIAIVIYSFIICYLEGTTKTLCIFTLHVILYKYLYKISIYDTIFLTFLYIILAIIPDLIVLFLMMIVIKMPEEIFYAQFNGSTVATLIVCALLILLVYIFRKILGKILNIKLDNNKTITIYIVLTLASVLVIFFNLSKKMVINEGSITSIIIMLTFVLILYSLVKQKIENNKIVEKYDKLLEFIKKYEIGIDEQKSLRHESKNQLITIKTKLIEKRANKEIIEYIDSLIDEHKGYAEDKYGKFQYLPANGIKGLFYYKAMEAEEKGIKLSINVSEKVEGSFLENLKVEDFKQLGRLIGIYLDNAIEASATSKKKQIGIEIYMIKEDILMIITNTYTGEIDKESVGKVKYTTKGNNRGYGLMLANRILTENKRFISDTKITDKLYEQKLTIKKRF